MQPDKEIRKDNLSWIISFLNGKTWTHLDFSDDLLS